MIYQIRKRTEPEDIAYSLYLYFLGLSLRNTSKAVSRFVKRNHTAIGDWIQRYKQNIHDITFNNRMQYRQSYSTIKLGTT